MRVIVPYMQQTRTYLIHLFTTASMLPIYSLLSKISTEHVQILSKWKKYVRSWATLSACNRKKRSTKWGLFRDPQLTWLVQHNSLMNDTLSWKWMVREGGGGTSSRFLKPESRSLSVITPPLVSSSLLKLAGHLGEKRQPLIRFCILRTSRAGSHLPRWLQRKLGKDAL